MERAWPRSGFNAARRLIDATPWSRRHMIHSDLYHKIAAAARMAPVDSTGFQELGDIGPAPPHAPLSFYVEYGPDPSEPELRLFIASSASPPKLPKPSQPPKSSKPRKRSIRKLVEQAKAAGVTAITLPDGTKLELTASSQQGNQVDE